MGEPFSLALRNSGLQQRADLHYIGEARPTGGTAGPALIGRIARIGNFEIVLQVMMSANE